MSSLDECESRWGNHPKWCAYSTSIYGEIIKVNEDGSINVKIDTWKPQEKIIENVELFHINSWEKDREELIIKNKKSQMQVGNWVELQEFRNLWYLYIWEKRYSYQYPDKVEVLYKFKCGKPEFGYKSHFKIMDIGDKDYINYMRCRLYE